MKKLILTVLTIILFSCNRNDENIIDLKSNTNHFISQKSVENLLKNSTFKTVFYKSKTTGKIINKQIEEIESVTSGKNIVYYIVNYKSGGYLIIAADDRINPILAMSETNSFDYDKAKQQNGISFWLEEQANAVNYVRNENIEQPIEIRNAWNSLSSIVSPDPTSGSTTTYINALLSTTWGQGATYNDFTPIGTCGTHTLTGCVATAMAQVLKFNQYSNTNNYNWSMMPDSYGTSETSRLMSDIGIAVYMQYGCFVSGAYDDYIPYGFSHFGYTNVRKTNSSIRNWIVNDLSLNRPVILCG